MMLADLSWLALVALAQGSLAAKHSCKPETFKNVAADVFGAEVVDIRANEVKQWNEYATTFPALPPLPKVPPVPVDVCNVTVIYTHPGTIKHANIVYQG